MHIATWVPHLLKGAAAIALLTSCSNGYSPATVPTSVGGAALMSGVREPAGGYASLAALLAGSRGIQFPAAALPTLDEKAAKLPGSLVYVSSPPTYLVSVYDAKGKSLGNIAPIAFPQGIFVDPSHNLWVAQPFFPNDHRFPQMATVLEFKRGETRPSKTLLDPVGIAVDVTICPSGTVYVANVLSKSDKGSGNVEVYAGGSTTPTGTLNYPSSSGRFNYWTTVTCDAAGNVFAGIDNQSFTRGLVVEFPGGNQSGATPIINNLLPLGIKANNAGNLLVNDSATGSVCEYTEAGKPTGSCVNAVGWNLFSVRNDGNEILGGSYGDPMAASLRFPGGQIDQTFPTSNPWAAAYDPG